MSLSVHFFLARSEERDYTPLDVNCGSKGASNDDEEE